MICCRDCRNFIKDPIGDGYGIGKCAEFEAYKAKNPGKDALRKALVKLGNKPDDDLFWGGTLTDRKCEKFLTV